MTDGSKSSHHSPASWLKLRGKEKLFSIAFGVSLYIVVIIVLKLILFRKVRVFTRKLSGTIFCECCSAFTVVMVALGAFIIGRLIPEDSVRLNWQPVAKNNYYQQ